MILAQEADMKQLYAAIDLHSNNSVLVVLDENDVMVYQKRLANSLSTIAQALAGCAGTIVGIAVESTFNWYWLVDGLQDAGYRPPLPLRRARRLLRASFLELLGRLL